MKNSDDTIGNRTRDFLASSTVPQKEHRVVCNHPMYIVCPDMLRVTLRILHVSHTLQGSAKQTLFPFVCH